MIDTGGFLAALECNKFVFGPGQDNSTFPAPTSSTSIQHSQFLSKLLETVVRHLCHDS